MEEHTPLYLLPLRFSVSYNGYSTGLLSGQAYQNRLFGESVESAALAR